VDARRRLLRDATLEMVLVAIVIVLANLLSVKAFARIDLTGDRRFSLDDASKALVVGLDKPLLVRAFFTPGLEAPYNNHEESFRDKIEEFRAYGRGRIELSVEDPGSDPGVARQAQEFGIHPLEYTVRRADRAELRKVYMGAVLVHGERTEVLPALTDLGSLEYELAAAIRRLTVKVEDIPTLAWSTGHGEPDLAKVDGPMRAFLESVARKARIRPVELGGVGLLDEDVDALLVVGPQAPLNDRALWQIDQFVMRGGAAAFFVTATRPDMRALRPVRVASGLEPLLAHLGVQVNRDIVLDRASNGAMAFPTRSGGRVVTRNVNYALIPRATDLGKESPLTRGMETLLVPFASSLGVAEPQAGTTLDVVARSSASAGAVQGLRTIDPAALENVLSSEKRGPFALAVAGTGSFRSFYETRPVPPADPEVPEEQDGLSQEEQKPIVEGAPARVFVVGSADFVANNPLFMQNLVDWLTQDTALVGIRSKLAALAPMRPTRAGERAAWKGVAIATGPLLLCAAGAARQLRFRRRARRTP
jgi:gliding-associated putative ABC transporter substrate-binding component GldG